ncbi:hypothetical protein DRP04_08100 [Archaeoglobales archaeon]|nr:MAG: hypothetical protein DRP04_08100 [Archaeoglobales archaeon]
MKNAYFHELGNLRAFFPKNTNKKGPLTKFGEDGQNYVKPTLLLNFWKIVKYNFTGKISRPLFARENCKVSFYKK